MIAAAAVVGNASAAAPKGTVAGKLVGISLPSAGSGEAFVRAVNLSTSEIVGRAAVNPQGRYSLKLPKGAFELIPSVVSPTRRLTPKVARVHAKAGQRLSISLRRASATAQLRPIVGIPDDAFTGGVDPLSVMNKGIIDMLITDLVAAPVTDACHITVVERSAKFMAAYNVEQMLRRSGSGTRRRSPGRDS